MRHGGALRAFNRVFVDRRGGGVGMYQPDPDLPLVKFEGRPVSIDDFLDGWAAHVSVATPSDVVIHPHVADAVVSRLDQRFSFAVVAKHALDVYFAVEDDSADVKRRVGEFAVSTVNFMGAAARLNAVRLIKTDTSR